MNILERINKLVVLALILLVIPTSFAAQQRTAYSTIDLIAEQTSIPDSGGNITVGFYLKPNSNWHAYWKNPGDAGKKPKLKWTLPEGFEASELSFPAPHAIPFQELVTYGYNEEVLLLTDITIPDGLAVGELITLKAKASWVVCDDELCVPERSELSLQLAVGTGENDSDVAELFSQARIKLPTDVDWPAQYEVVGDKVNIGVQTPESSMLMNSPYLFVEPRRTVAYNDQTIAFAPRGFTVTMSKGSKVDKQQEVNAVFTYLNEDGDNVAVRITASKATGSLSALTSGASGGNSDTGGLTWGIAFLFAFLGGIILNLMPCVFPILSMKALSLVQMSHADQKEARASGVLYTLGILVAFCIFGGALIAIREAGHAVGWGFQMQNPIVNLAIGLLMIAIALNLFGLFEIGTKMMSTGQSLTQGSERKAAFFTGLLAVVVATPCTAPFMAGALGYALSQPAFISMSIFVALGFGLALPYLLLSFVPSLGKVMPKPGPWMEVFRQVLAFPMLITAVWIFWIIGKQLGIDSLMVALLSAVSFAFALWAYGKSAFSAKRKVWFAVMTIGFVGTIVSANKMTTLKSLPGTVAHQSAGTLGQLELEHFSPEKLLNYIEEGQPTFVYFTADWCVSCKVNERVALASDEVGQAFNEKGIKVVEGDWTNEDPVITEWLEKYNRIGVPLYLYFPKGSSVETALILPQVLFPEPLIAAIEASDANSKGKAAEVININDVETDTSTVVDTTEQLTAEPDWSIVQAYIDTDDAWHELDNQIRKETKDKKELATRLEKELGPHPDIKQADLAAIAIVSQEEFHQKTKQAAEFLINHSMRTDNATKHIGIAVKAIVKNFKDYNWPSLMLTVDYAVRPNDSKNVEDMYAHIAENNDSPQIRGIAKFYQSSRLIRLINDIETSREERKIYREKAYELISNLSNGIENEDLITRQRYDKNKQPIPFKKMSEVKEIMLYNLNSVSVGNKLPNETASRVDGQLESLVEHEGKVVLIDVWATWCAPCMVSMPKLEELNNKLADTNFETISISVDAELESVTEYQLDQPMPWTNWHIGPKGEIIKKWAIRGYPTYILLDENGVVLAKTHDLDEQLISLVNGAVCESDKNKGTLACS